MRSLGRVAIAAAIAAALTAGPSMPAEAASDSSSAKTIYSLSNTERGKRSLPKLKRSSALDKVAAAWAKKMTSTANGKCVIGPKGLRHNPSVKSQLPKGWKKVGENVGCGYTTSGASGMLNAWMQSSGHRGNILSKSFTDIGVGYYTDAEGMTWGVQVFAQYPKSSGSASKAKTKSTPQAKPKASKAPSAPKTTSRAAPQAELEAAAVSPGAAARSITAFGSASAALIDLGLNHAEQRISALIRMLQQITPERAGAAAPEAPRGP